MEAEGLRGLELRILHALNCDAEGPFLGGLVSFVNASVFTGAVFVLLFLVPSLRARARARLPRVLLAGLLALGLAHGLKQLVWWTWDRPRPGDLFTPAETLEGPLEIATCGDHADLWVKRGHAPDEPSFPSSHAVTVGALAAAVTLLSPWAGALAWLYALLVGLGRLYLGKHWPTDIVGSLALAAGLGWLSWRLVPRLQAAWRGRVASERPDAPVDQG